VLFIETLHSVTPVFVLHLVIPTAFCTLELLSCYWLSISQFKDYKVFNLYVSREGSIKVIFIITFNQPVVTEQVASEINRLADQDSTLKIIAGSVSVTGMSAADEVIDLCLCVIPLTYCIY